MIGIRILKGLPVALLEEAIKIYCEAFYQKLIPLVGNRQKITPFIKKTTDFDACFYAINSGKVLGIAGIQDRANNFIRNVSLGELLKDFTLLRSLLIRYVYRYKTAKVAEDLVRIDSIAVAKDARGTGIGTALINKVFEYAADNNLKKVMLEVVDTNSGAKRLYERLGFEVVREKKYGLITKRAGFTSEFIMLRKLS